MGWSSHGTKKGKKAPARMEGGIEAGALVKTTRSL